MVEVFAVLVEFQQIVQQELAFCQTVYLRMLGGYGRHMYVCMSVCMWGLWDCFYVDFRVDLFDDTIHISEPAFGRRSRITLYDYSRSVLQDDFVFWVGMSSINI